MQPYFAIQLCCYAEMLENIQGLLPKKVVIILGDNKINNLKLKDYFGYYKSLKLNFINFHNNWTIDCTPDPFESSSHGRWSEYAQKILEKKRHLSLIANITKSQIKRLENIDIKTIDGLVSSIRKSVPKLNRDIFERLKSQAKLQIVSEKKDKPSYEILPHDNDRLIGLSLLPPHSNSDVFFDLEGLPHIEGGLEYLWGSVYFDKFGKRQFKDFWSHEQIE